MLLLRRWYAVRGRPRREGLLKNTAGGTILRIVVQDMVDCFTLARLVNEASSSANFTGVKRARAPLFILSGWMGVQESLPFLHQVGVGNLSWLM